MTFKVDDRIFETSVTTGTGTYTLDGPVTGYQAFSEMTANNYCPYFVTMDNSASWEAGIGQVLGSPARLVRTHVLASSNTDAAVDWGAGTKNVRCGQIAPLAVPRRTSKGVAGNSNITLTQNEMRCQVLEFTGALTGNIDVIVDDTVWKWIVYNNTTGAFSLTLKVTGQTGVPVAQKRAVRLHCNGTDVVRPGDTGNQEYRSSNTILGAGDCGKTIIVSGGTFSQTFDATATLGKGWFVIYRNTTSGTITLDPNGAELIDGAATLTIENCGSCVIISTGSELFTIGLTGINGLTVDAAPDGETDYLKTFDSSANALKKVLVNKMTAMKVMSFTRDTSAASGSVSYTGAGFKPKGAVFFAAVNGNVGQASFGVDDGTNHNVIRDNYNATPNTWGTSSTESISSLVSAVTGQDGHVSSWDADGWTIAWTKIGATAATTLEIKALVWR